MRLILETVCVHTLEMAQAVEESVQRATLHWSAKQWRSIILVAATGVLEKRKTVVLPPLEEQDRKEYAHAREETDRFLAGVQRRIGARALMDAIAHGCRVEGADTAKAVSPCAITQATEDVIEITIFGTHPLRKTREESRHFVHKDLVSFVQALMQVANWGEWLEQIVDVLTTGQSPVVEPLLPWLEEQLQPYVQGFGLATRMIYESVVGPLPVDRHAALAAWLQQTDLAVLLQTASGVLWSDAAEKWKNEPKKTYKRLARLVHPDKQPLDASAERRGEAHHVFNALHTAHQRTKQ